MSSVRLSCTKRQDKGGYHTRATHKGPCSKLESGPLTSLYPLLEAFHDTIAQEPIGLHSLLARLEVAEQHERSLNELAELYDGYWE